MANLNFMELTSVCSLAGDSFAGGVADSLIEALFLRGHAVGFFEHGEGLGQLQVVDLFAAHPWLGIRLWVIERHGYFKRHSIGMADALLQVHPFAVRITEVIEPSSFVITGG